MEYFIRIEKIKFEAKDSRSPLAFKWTMKTKLEK